MRRYLKDLSTEEIIADLVKGRKNGFIRLEFIGGESTTRKDIFFLIRYAKHLGFKEICITTNGRMFAYCDFCKKIIDAGLNSINFSIYGHTPSLHNAICRSKDAYAQLIEGIRNIQSFNKDIHCCVNTVVTKLNYFYLKEIGDFISLFDIDSWNIVNLIPDGIAIKHYGSFLVRLYDLYKHFNKKETIGMFYNFKNILLFDFPNCIFNKEIVNSPIIRIITAGEKFISTKQVGYNSERIFFSKNKKKYKDSHKSMLPICYRCKSYKVCGGIWNEYLKLFGEQEVTREMKSIKSEMCHD